jgi:hypothetical protein
MCWLWTEAHSVVYASKVVAGSNECHCRAPGTHDSVIMEANRGPTSEYQLDAPFGGQTISSQPFKKGVLQAVLRAMELGLLSVSSNQLHEDSRQTGILASTKGRLARTG